jgi:hypothetical protein
MSEDQIFFKFLRAADKINDARFMAFFRNPEACWFDDYQEASDEFSLFSQTVRAGCS